MKFSCLEMIIGTNDLKHGLQCEEKSTNRPFDKLRHEQHLPRFRNNAMTTNSQRIFLDVYSFHKSMIRGLKRDNHLGNRFKTRQALFVT